VTQEHAERDLPFRVLLEGAVDGEVGEVAGDRRVEVEASGGDRLHESRGGEQLRHRLDAEDGVGRDRWRIGPIEVAEAFDPQRLVRVDDGDGEPRDALLGHDLRDAGAVAGDDRCDRVGRDRERCGARQACRRSQ